MYASIADLGEKFNRQQQAQAMVDEFNTFMQEYKDKNAGKEAPKVLILMGLPGLISWQPRIAMSAVLSKWQADRMYTQALMKNF